MTPRGGSLRYLRGPHQQTGGGRGMSWGARVQGASPRHHNRVVITPRLCMPPVLAAVGPLPQPLHKPSRASASRCQIHPRSPDLKDGGGSRWGRDGAVQRASPADPARLAEIGGGGVAQPARVTTAGAEPYQQIRRPCEYRRCGLRVPSEFRKVKVQTSVVMVEAEKITL